jgi:hypothetical protein
LQIACAWSEILVQSYYALHCAALTGKGERMAKHARFPIGLAFTYKRGKAPALEYRIVDILTTRNNAGEVVRLEYDTVHLFCGQEVHETIVDTTIARSLAPEVFALYNK